MIPPCTGKATLIIGACHSIGESLSANLLYAGAKCLIILDKQIPTTLCEGLTTVGFRVICHKVKLTDRPAVRQALTSATTEIGGKIDVVIVNSEYKPHLNLVPFTDTGMYEAVRECIQFTTPTASIIHVSGNPSQKTPPTTAKESTSFPIFLSPTELYLHGVSVEIRSSGCTRYMSLGGTLTSRIRSHPTLQ